MKEINPSRQMQDDKCDALVRTLTASSIESRAEWRIESGKQRSPVQGFLTLGGSAGSSRSKTEGEVGKERGRGNHTRKSNENAAEDACLSRRPSLAFISQRAFGRYKGG